MVFCQNPGSKPGYRCVRREDRRRMDRKNMTMKERPQTERPYEKCMESGAESLTDGELLAVILRCGIRNCSALELACKLLEKHPVYEGLAGLHHLDYHTLREIPGIGKVKAVELLCVMELSKRLARASVDRQVEFTSPDYVASFYMEDMRHLESEQVRLLLLNNRSRLIRDVVLSRGTVNQALVPVRDIFVTALRYGAVSLILLHNHPSGDPEPSREDILLTNRLKEAGLMLDIPLVDHIIIGDCCYCSFRERQML